MRRRTKTLFFLFAVVGALLFAACRAERAVVDHRAMPPVFLWAWEREEDLRFLDPKRFGVAFLAQTLVLDRDEVIFRPRRQPLKIAPDAYLIAVTRVESLRESARRPALSAAQRGKIVRLISQTLELPGVRGVQLDFDAARSEREFYRALVNDLKNELPGETPLSITALASWCAGDNWFRDLPIDEAVPMVFVMGADRERIRSFLVRGNDWREPLCRGSYGLSVDEPLAADFRPGRRFYYFKSSAWTKMDLEKIR